MTASRMGYYDAALQLEFVLPALKRNAGKESRLRLYLAYDLASQFILFHVGHEIDTAQVEGTQLGPNLIAGYLSQCARITKAIAAMPKLEPARVDGIKWDTPIAIPAKSKPGPIARKKSDSPERV